MAMDDAEFQLAFDAEAGDAASLATAEQKRRWFNSGQARIGRYLPKSAELTWVIGDRHVTLPADFAKLAKLVWNDLTSYEPFVLRGQLLVIDDEGGATGAGGARLYYEADYPLLDDSPAQPSVGTRLHDEACLSYALSRFYKKLASNRAQYKRYSTLVGANAVSESDLQSEGDRHYSDFLDAREDLAPDAPVSPYGGE